MLHVANLSQNFNHGKQIRRFFLLCMILFNADDRCSLPLHTLLTDMIDSQGGTALLVKILNRLGICASADTLSRFIQYKACSPENATNKQLDPECFTVVSADNIDFMHIFARVYKGNENASWHGTTVQVVQPIPTLSQTCTSGDVTEPVSNTDSSKECNMTVDPQVTKQSSQHLE